MGGFSDILLFPERIFKRTRSKDEVHKGKKKVGKFEVKKVKNMGVVSKNVVQVRNLSMLPLNLMKAWKEKKSAVIVA